VEETSERLIEAMQDVADASRHARKVFEGVEDLLESAIVGLRGGGAVGTRRHGDAGLATSRSRRPIRSW
jgi:hypothetical protein